VCSLFDDSAERAAHGTLARTKEKRQGSLYKEALTDDKWRKYARALAEEDSGTAQLFFLSPEDRRSDIEFFGSGWHDSEILDC
jgi:hypothetical protein